MAKSRVIAVSAALAVGTSALVAPQSFAATVGPRVDNECKVTFTEAEQKADKSRSDLLDGYYKSLFAAVDEVFPGAKKIQAQAMQEPAVKELVNAFAASLEALSDPSLSEAESKRLGARSDAADAAAEPVLKKYEDQLVGLGMTRDAAEALTAASVLLATSAREPSEPAPSFSVSVYEWDKPEELRKVTTVEQYERKTVDELADSFGLNASQKETFRKAFLTDTVKAANKGQVAEDNAYNQAKLACLDGGNKTVAYPTEILRGNPFDGSSIEDLSSGVQSSESDELSPAAIAAIVIGVLAVVGIGGVFAAPALGIELPFEVPALPF